MNRVHAIRLKADSGGNNFIVSLDRLHAIGDIECAGLCFYLFHSYSTFRTYSDETWNHLSYLTIAVKRFYSS